MYRSLFISALLFCFLLSPSAAEAQKSTEVCYNPNAVADTGKKSIRSQAFARVGDDSIKINYHSPGVRKRVIWGGLVPYDEVWVTGAHDATSLEIPFPVTVGGKEIPAGKYAFFTIPGKKDWILIINRNWQQHLVSEYDQAEDIVRVRVKPGKTGYTERLQYFVNLETGDKGTIAVAWEKKRVELPFTVRTRK